LSPFQNLLRQWDLSHAEAHCFRPSLHFVDDAYKGVCFPSPELEKFSFLYDCGQFPPSGPTLIFFLVSPRILRIWLLFHYQGTTYWLYLLGPNSFIIIGVNFFGPFSFTLKISYQFVGNDLTLLVSVFPPCYYGLHLFSFFPSRLL